MTNTKAQSIGNRLVLIIILIVIGSILSACGLDIKGHLATRNAQPLPIRQSNGKFVQLHPGDYEVALVPGSVVRKGRFEISNMKGDVVAKIQTPEARNLTAFNFSLPAAAINQKFDLVGHRKELPDQVRTYQKNNYVCTYCGECLDNDAIDENYKPNLLEEIDNNFQHVPKKSPRVQMNCKCSGVKQVKLQETISTVQYSLFFRDGVKSIARFRSDLSSTKDTKVLEDISSCGPANKMTVTEMINAVPAVVNAVPKVVDAIGDLDSE